MIGCEVRRVTSCASTNDLASAWASDAQHRAPHGAVIVAETQTAGRGRLGREWHSPSGENLYISCVLRPSLPSEEVPPITLCAGLAVCEVVNSLGIDASIKWPNDVLVGDRKLAGVLTEMSSSSRNLSSQTASPNAVVVGIGLNVNTMVFPAELAATSIALESERTHKLPAILGSVLFALDEWYEKYLGEGVGALEGAFSRHSCLAGREVRAKVGSSLISGRVVSLGHDGSLLIEDAQGSQHSIRSGEVELVQ